MKCLISYLKIKRTHAPWWLVAVQHIHALHAPALGGGRQKANVAENQGFR